MNRSRFLTQGLGMLVILSVVGCDAQTTMGVEEVAGPSFSVAATNSALVCPTNRTRAISAVISPAGGTVELDGHSVTLPPGAVTQPTEITLRVPKSRYLIVNLRADGEEFIQFTEPVLVTISYERCKRRDIDSRDLGAWEFDPASQQLMGDEMTSQIDRRKRSVTFETYHFSHFAIAD